MLVVYTFIRYALLVHLILDSNATFLKAVIHMVQSYPKFIRWVSYKVHASYKEESIKVS